MIKNMYLQAIADELSPDDFVDLWKESMYNLGLLKDEGPENELMENCFRAVKTILNVTTDQLRADTKKRIRPLVLARQWHMFLLNRVANMSLSMAGEVYGKDHATVLHTVKTLCNQRHFNKAFRMQFQNVIDELEKHNPKIFVYEAK